MITFVSPWVFGFTTVTAVAWTAWILGILTVLSAGSLLLTGSRRLTAA